MTRSWWLEAAPDPIEPMPPGSLEEGAGAEVVIVGMGTSGLEAAVLLAERGVDVLVVDAVGVAGGAAGANGGFLLAGLADFHHDAVSRRGRAEALSWWHRTAAELDRVAAEEPTVRRVGSLRVAASVGELADIDAQLARMRSDGLVAERYEGPEGAGLLVPGDGVVDPVARCRRLAGRAVAAGARLVAPTRVTSVGTGRVVAGGRVVGCRAVLVCVDGGLDALVVEGTAEGSGGSASAGAAGVPWPPTGLRSVRLQMLATAPTASVLTRPVYRRGGMDYVQQLASGEVLLGGGRDVDDAAEWPPAGDPWGAAVPSEAVQTHLDGWLAELGFTAPVTHRWAAWAAFTDDRMPIDARVVPGVHVVGGYSGHGNLIGGMLAREAAADLLEGRP